MDSDKCNEYFEYFYKNSKDEIKLLFEILDTYLKTGGKRKLDELEGSRIIK